MLDILIDTILDSVRMLPFLFVTYLMMEALEHKAGKKTKDMIKRAGKIGPLWGSILGVFPQCGFSSAASSLYVGRVVSLGTLIAIYLSTSDEMLPVLISESVGVMTIIKILGLKMLIGIVTGFIIDIIYVKLLKHREKAEDNYESEELDHCNCDHAHKHGIFVSSVKHTFKIFAFIFIISLLLNVIIEFVGEDAISNVFVSVPVVGQLIAGLVGLIPNCVSSVVITRLYLEGIINGGVMMAGLLVNAGAGTLILFRSNKSFKENINIIVLLYVLGVIWGCIIEFSGIAF